MTAVREVPRAQAFSRCKHVHCVAALVPSLPRASALPPIEPYPTKQPTSVPRAPKLHRRTVLS